MIQIEGFSEKYYGLIQTTKTETNEVFKAGTISVMDRQSGQELIRLSAEELTFEIRQTKPGSEPEVLPYEEQNILFFEDVNFDGLPDVILQDGQNSCYHGPSFQVFLAEGKRFVYQADFTRLAQEYCGMFRVDPVEQKLYTVIKSGCCWHEYCEFVVENNRPQAQRVMEEDASGFPYLITTTSEWKNGVPTETVKKTLDLEQEGITSLFSFDLAQNGKKAVLFTLDGRTLNYALFQLDGSIEFDFPIEVSAPHPDFKYGANDQRVKLGFMNQSATYEMYQLESGCDIQEVGLIMRVMGKEYKLPGKLETLQGNLRQIETRPLENISYQGGH